METQNQIKRTLSHPEAIVLVKELLEIYGNTKLMAFAEKLCDQLGFYNPQGQKQRAGCLKALRELEQTDLITLPQPLQRLKKRSPRHLDAPLPKPRCVPSEVGEIGELRLIVLEIEKQMRIQNEMMMPS